MARRSHGRCKVCRAVIHSAHRYGMCKQCSDRHQARLAAERRATKERRAQRQLAALTPVLEEDQAMTDTPAPDKITRSRRNLTEDQKVQILDAYTTTDESVKAISARFEIHETYIYNVLDRVGVSWRRGNPESFVTWQANQHPEDAVIEGEDSIPGPQAKALENMLKLDQSSGMTSPYPTVLPPKPEPVAPTPAVERRVREEFNWQVEISGILNVKASTIDEALFEARRRGGSLVKVTSIKLVD